MIVMKSIKPKRLQSDVFIKEFIAGIQDIEHDTISEFNKTTETWKGEKPTFIGDFDIDKQRGELVLLVGPGGSTKGAQKWEWLDKGTKVRYATLSPDWVSKTTPNVVGSGAGRGRVLFVSKKRPRPGIEARNWDKIVTKQMKPRFKRRMEKAIKIAVSKCGHRM